MTYDELNPCRDCPRKGCGAYHDECPHYQKASEEKKRLRLLANKGRIKYTTAHKHMKAPTRNHGKNYNEV